MGEKHPQSDVEDEIPGWPKVKTELQSLELEGERPGGIQAEELLRKRVQEQRMLSEALAQLLAAEEPDEVVRGLFPKVAAHLAVDTYINFLVNERGDALSLNSYAGLSPEQAQGLGRVEFGQIICGRVAQRQEALVMSDLQCCEWPDASLPRRLGLRVYACHPLVSRGKLLGTLAFASRTRTHLEPFEVQFLRLISDYAAVAIDRARSGRELRQSEERLRLALDTAVLGTYARDLRTNELSLNRTCRELLGVPEGEPPADVAYRVLHPEDRQRVLAEAARAFDPAIRAHCTAEFRLLRGDGTLRWVSGRGRVVFDDTAASPRPVKFLGVLQDITERKLAEQELLRTRADLCRANAELEQRVQERTAKLQEALAELEQMSYSMIHDMRAPLRAVHSFASLLQSDPQTHLSAKGQEMLAKMKTAVSRMDHLVRDALGYTVVLRQELGLEPLDVAALARGILQTYTDFQPPRALVTVAPAMPWVLANQAALTQCLSHLLDNAVKFVRPGQVPQVEVLAEPIRPGWVRLQVKDNGLGIAPENQDKVFRIFERLAHSGEGTGIGLAIVKKAVERMGGRVGVESAPGQGSRFWMELKAAA